MTPPEKLGKYRVISLLATGGMGELFVARQEGPAGFAKTVVVKKILRHLSYDQSFVDMFVNEARLAAQLSHPNIVQIFELGQEEGDWFIAMEYVHGRSLRAIQEQLLLQREVLSAHLAARLCAQALHGLHYAHNLTDESGRKLGIVHRDVSPENVLVSFAGVVKLVDFGIAKAIGSVSTTRTGTLKGKYGYMAPEQLRGDPVDARADLFAMGILLFELLSGMRPFTAENETAMIHAILNDEPPKLRALNPNVPAAMEGLVAKALSKNPTDRFGSADEMAGALEQFVLSTGENLSAGHVGQFLKDLFGADAMNNPYGPSQPKERSDGHGVHPRGTAVLPAEPVALGDELPKEAAQAATIVVPHLDLADAPPGATEVASVPSRVEDTQIALVPPHGVRWSWLFAGFGVLAAAGALFFVFGGEPSSAKRAAVDAPAAAPSVMPPLVLNEPEPAPEPVPEPEPEPAPVAAAVDAGQDVEVAAAPVKPAPDLEPERKPTKVVTTRVVKKKPTPKPGKVTLRVNPYAEVFYEGKSLGLTPIPAVEVPAGLVSFTLKNKQLGVTKRVSVRVPAGGQVVLKADMFEKGSM